MLKDIGLVYENSAVYGEPKDSRDKAEALVEDYSRFWMSIIGTRGATGKKTVNAQTKFGELFE